MYALSFLLLFLHLHLLAVLAVQFVAPSAGPLIASTNYVGASNGSLSRTHVVAGKAFNRIVNIWLEKADFSTADSTVRVSNVFPAFPLTHLVCPPAQTAFEDLSKQGLLLNQYCALTYPSQPNYIAAVGGDFFGMSDDNLYHIPSNISTVVDLLEAKNISWASYQENMPFDGYEGFNFASKNYVNTSAPDYIYYARKHNPTIIYDSVASVPSRLARHRNFNDLAVDVNASALPQWVFVSPNLVNNGRDTSIEYAASWLEYWLVPLLNNKNFNDNHTLIVLTFDENESHHKNNCVLTLLLGGAVPQRLRGTIDSTYYTHYSLLSTVEANWGLGSLGRGDTNKPLSNVFSFVADATGYKNLDVDSDNILTNTSGKTAGPLNPVLYVPFTAPNKAAVGAGGGPVFIGPGMNTGFTAAVAPAPVNLTTQNKTVPWSGLRNNSTDVVRSGTGKSGAINMREDIIRAAVLGAILSGVVAVLA
ncbi:phosphoesterase family-domain-containing protein [Russula earlei]|uniref:Phosphoesterase family-domain-containing protein n=1 Tax=Russula earlei TaxID=71964 RepID=A0ACC0U4G3_9AGAM|nr:phosphoesterase family-domain-containing protein [Russula earlei]